MHPNVMQHCLQQPRHENNSNSYEQTWHTYEDVVIYIQWNITKPLKKYRHLLQHGWTKKSDRGRLWNLKNNTNESIYKTEIDS